MKIILDFISNNFGVIFLFCIVFGGGIATFFSRIISERHERKLQEMKHKNRLQILEERRRIAEAENDAIKLLVADTALGRDFDQRLRIALDKADLKDPQTKTAADPEIDDDLIEESAARPRRSKQRSA